jgi:serine/threonine protein kinase
VFAPGATILAFGVAEEIQSAAVRSTAPLLTQPGIIMGTLNYMSPEQVHGQRLDARTDICNSTLCERTIASMLSWQS